MLARNLEMLFSLLFSYPISRKKCSAASAGPCTTTSAHCLPSLLIPGPLAVALTPFLAALVPIVPGLLALRLPPPFAALALLHMRRRALDLPHCGAALHFSNRRTPATATLATLSVEKVLRTGRVTKCESTGPTMRPMLCWSTITDDVRPSTNSSTFLS